VPPPRVCALDMCSHAVVPQASTAFVRKGEDQTSETVQDGTNRSEAKLAKKGSVECFGEHPSQ
jgi:hypothetical protein